MNRQNPHIRLAALATLVAAIAAFSSACSPLEGGAGAAGDAHLDAVPVQQPSHVDSVFSIDEEIRRFRSAIPATAARLENGAASREELVARFLSALERRDTTALNALTLTAAEFIDLYYPHTRFTRRPYEMSPQLVWFQLQNHGSRGLDRALARFGGRPLGVVGHACESLDEEGPNRIHGRCSLSSRQGTESLFGQILERDGEFKFMSYANGL